MNERASYQPTGIDQQSSNNGGKDAEDEKDPDDIFRCEDGLPGLQSLLSEGCVGGASARLLLFGRRLLVYGGLRRIHPGPGLKGGCESATLGNSMMQIPCACAYSSVLVGLG